MGSAEQRHHPKTHTKHGGRASSQHLDFKTGQIDNIKSRIVRTQPIIRVRETPRQLFPRPLRPSPIHCASAQGQTQSRIEARGERAAGTGEGRSIRPPWRVVNQPREGTQSIRGTAVDKNVVPPRGEEKSILLGRPRVVKGKTGGSIPKDGPRGNALGEEELHGASDERVKKRGTHRFQPLVILEGEAVPGIVRGKEPGSGRYVAEGRIFRPRNKISQMVNYSDRDPGIDVSTSFAIVVWARLQGRGGWAWKVSARSI